MKKILVIGGTNFVGPYILKSLLNRGMEVSVLNRGRHRNVYADSVEQLIADTNLDCEGTKKALQGRRFDAIIDSVAYSPQAVMNVLSSADTGRYIQISTMGVYGFIDGPVEEGAWNPYSFDWKSVFDNGSKDYGTRKKAAEAVAYQVFKDISVSTVRPAYVTDPNNIAHELNSRFYDLIHIVKNREEIALDSGNWKCCFTNVEDEARLITELVGTDYNGAVNIAAEKFVTIREIISFIERKVNVKAIYSDVGVEPGFNGKVFLDVNGCKERFFAPTDLNEWLWPMIEDMTVHDVQHKNEWKDILRSYDCFS